MFEKLCESCSDETCSFVCLGSSVAVVPAAAQRVLCGANPLSGVLVGCLSQHPWGLFLMASTFTLSNLETNFIEQPLYIFALYTLYLRKREVNIYVSFVKF
jgi:hypothetical protein